MVPDRDWNRKGPCSLSKRHTSLSYGEWSFELSVVSLAAPLLRGASALGDSPRLWVSYTGPSSTGWGGARAGDWRCPYAVCIMPWAPCGRWEVSEMPRPPQCRRTECHRVSRPSVMLTFDACLNSAPQAEDTALAAGSASSGGYVVPCTPCNSIIMRCAAPRRVKRKRRRRAGRAQEIP